MADDARDTQTVILDAALEAVLAHGIRRTTASDIAKRSGLARQTVYRYWPDTRALFAALITRELLAALPVAGEAHDLDALVVALVDTADAIRTLPLVERVRATDPEMLSTYVFERLGTSQRAIHAEIATRLGAAQRAGVVRSGDVEAMAAMVLLLTQSAVQSAPLVEQWLPPRAWRDELARALRGYLAEARE